MIAGEPAHMSDNLAEAWLDRRQVQAMARISKSGLYKAIAEQRAPAPVKLGRRFVRWRRSDVLLWLRDPSTWTQRATREAAP